MEVLNYFKQIYSGKKALENHISLFAIVGIFITAFLKYTASFGSMLIYEDFFIAVPSTNKELCFYLFICILSLFYLIGYCFKFINRVYYNKETLLPDFTLAPFYTFVGFLPVVLCWNLYYLISCVVGWGCLMFVNQPSVYYLFVAIMLCLIPFFYMMVVAFAKRMKYEKTYFSYKNAFRIMNLTFGRVICLGLQILMLAIVPAFILSEVLTLNLAEKYLQLVTAIKLGTFCISTYLAVILFYVFNIGVVNIMKNNTPDMV